MRVLLFNSCAVSAPSDHLQRLAPHLRVGPAVIAACLRRDGHETHILDPRADGMGLEPSLRAAVALRPDLVGFSAFTEEIADAAALAAGIKSACPDALTVVGGYHASALPQRTLEEFSDFDLSVSGEGEGPMSALTSGLPYGEIAGLAWRDGNGQIRVNPAVTRFPALDELPPPAWDLYDHAKYGFRLPVEPSRTCPFRCNFCFQATSETARFKSPEHIIDEIEEGVGRYGAQEISFGSAGAFPLKRSHAMAVCDRMMARDIRVPWITATRADALDRDLLAAMKASGCVYVSLGIETGDQEILSRCNKGLRLEQAEETIRLIREAGIESEMCFIIGLPGETRESLQKTRKFAMAMRPYATMASFAILTPFPGSEVFHMAESGQQGMGLATRDWSLYSKQGGTALHHGQFTAKELKRWQARLYMEFYLGSPAKAFGMLRSRNMREVLSLRRALALLGRML